HLPAREQRAFDVPIVARPVRRQDERAFSRAHEEPPSAHGSPPSRSRTTILSNDDRRPSVSTASAGRPPDNVKVIGLGRNRRVKPWRSRSSMSSTSFGLQGFKRLPPR